MRLRPLLLTLPLLALSAPLAAQDGSAPDLGAAIDLASTQAPVTGTLRADLDLDGIEEAVLIYGSGCEGDACPWRLVGRHPDGSGWGVVAGGFGARTHLVETHPSGHVIVSDGVILAWDGERLMPHHDLIAMTPERRATAGEARELRILLSGTFRPMQMRVLEFDPFRTGEIWRLILIDPDGSDPDGPSPFHLLGPDGALRHSGAAHGRPWAYADADGAGAVLRLVSLTRSGLLVETAR